MKTLFKTILVFLIPCIAFAGELPYKSKPRRNCNTSSNYQAGYNVIPNLILSNPNTALVFCGTQISISVNVSGGGSIIAACSEGVEAIRITNGVVYVDSTNDYNVEGTNEDDIIIVCRVGSGSGFSHPPRPNGVTTINGLGGNDTIVQCPNEYSVFIF